MQVHEQWPDLQTKQFNYQELSATMYFLYTNTLNPEFYRGRMIPYGVIQQLTQLVLFQTTYYLFLAVYHVHTKAVIRSAHFIVWAKINIARFQRLAISSIAFALPDVQLLLGHILTAYHTDMSNNVFPPYVNPPQPLDDEVLLGRALCKVFLIECKTCLRHDLRNDHSIADVTDRMTHVDHHYVINRHFAGTAMDALPDYRAMVHNHRLDDIPFLIPFWPFDNIYGRQVAMSHVAATLLTFTHTNNHWRHQPFREYDASRNPVDQLIDHCPRYYSVRAALLAFRQELPPLFHPDPGAVPDEPLDAHDSPLRNSLSPPPSVEMEDNADEIRSYSETFVLDHLHPQEPPVAIGYFHEPDEDVLSLVSHESTPAYLHVDLPVAPEPTPMIEDDPQTPPKRARET
jgi:hypothetical protein